MAIPTDFVNLTDLPESEFLDELAIAVESSDPAQPSKHMQLSKITKKMHTDSAGQLGGVYEKDYKTGDTIPVNAMKDKLMYWHNDQFYSVGTDTGFTSNDFDADLTAGRFVSASLTTQIQQWRDAGDVRGWGVTGGGHDETVKIQQAINDNVLVKRTTTFPDLTFGITSLNCNAQFLSLKAGDNTVFHYVGAGNETVFDAGGDYAHSWVKFRKIKLYLLEKPNVVGFDLTYITNQSLVEDIFIGEVRLNSVGIRINSGWFFNFNRVAIEGGLSGGNIRTGRGLEIISSNEAINGVNFENIRLHSLDVGLRFKTDQYSCYGNFFSGGNVEACNTGVEVLDLGGKEINQLSFSNYYMEGNQKCTIKVQCVTPTAYISLDNIYADIHTGLLDTTDNNSVVTLEECGYLSIKNTNGTWVSARDVVKSNKTEDLHRVVKSSSRAITPKTASGQVTADLQIDGVSFGVVPVLRQSVRAKISSSLNPHVFANAQTNNNVSYGGVTGIVEVFIHPLYSTTDTFYAKYTVLKTDNTHYRIKKVSGDESSLFNVVRDLESGDLTVYLKNQEESAVEVVWVCY